MSFSYPFFPPVIIFLYCIWTRCLFKLLDFPHSESMHTTDLFLEPFEPYILEKNFYPGASVAEGTAHRNVCCDLKCAKPEVNKSMRGFDFSFKALSIPVMFRSVGNVNNLWSPDVWNIFWGLTQLIYNSDKKYHRKFYTVKRYRHDWTSPVTQTRFLRADSCHWSIWWYSSILF